MQDEKALPLPFIVRDMLRFEGAAAFDLEVTTASDTAEAVEVTGMTREGFFRFNFTTTSDSLRISRTFAIPDLPTWVNVRPTGLTGQANAINALVYLLINKTRVQLLCQGQLSHMYAINWPQQSPLVPMQGRGKSKAILGADPAANVEATITVPDGQYWILKSVRGTLVTDANAATRAAVLTITHRNGEIIQCPAAGTQVASLTNKYNWFAGAAAINDATGLQKSQPLPLDLMLPPGSTIDTATTNRQVTDNWGPLSALVEIFFIELP